MAQTLMSRNVRFELYFRMLDTPIVSEVYTLGRGRLRHRRVKATTRIVMEGFPSSGNTFARQAFLLANPHIHPDDICSHTHAPRVAIKAVQRGVPCIVLIRDPRDAVASTVQRFTGIHLSSAFAYYERYYRKLMPMRDQFVVAPFPTLIDDFGSILRRCSEKYNKDLTGTKTDVSNTEVLQSIETRTSRRHHGRIPEERVSRPSAKRLRADEFLKQMSAGEQHARDRALSVYQEFIAAPPEAT